MIDDDDEQIWDLVLFVVAWIAVGMVLGVISTLVAIGFVSQ